MFSLNGCIAIILLCVVASVNCDICDVCDCFRGNVTNNSSTKIFCKGSVKNPINIQLNNIQWPTGDGDHDLEAHFNELNINYLPRFLNKKKNLLSRF